MIATLSDVKTGLLISSSTDDTLLDQLLTAADAFIEAHCGRSFAGGTFTETLPAGGTRLFLRNFPVDSVSSVKIDSARQFGSDTVRDSDLYVLHADRGVIESLTGPFLPPDTVGPLDWPGAAQVVYSTPTNQVPTPVQQAFTELVGHWYRQMKTAADQSYRMLTELTTGTDIKTYPWDLARGLKIPPGVLQLLMAYRVVPA